MGTNNEQPGPTHARPTVLISLRYASASSKFASSAQALMRQEYVRASGGVARLFFILSSNETPWPHRPAREHWFIVRPMISKCTTQQGGRNETSVQAQHTRTLKHKDNEDGA